MNWTCGVSGPATAQHRQPSLPIISNIHKGTPVSDPLSAAIEAAVQRAVEKQVPKILDAVRSIKSEPAPRLDEDRFCRMAEVARLLGVHRTTLHRMSRAGKLPPARKIGSAAGYLMSDIRKIQIGEAA